MNSNSNDENDILYDIPVEGLKNYKITKSGKIWSNNKEDFLKTRIHNGYETISITRKYIECSIHRLVALTFLKNENNLPIVNHIDENKLNNHVSNLEWTTQKENINKSTKITCHKKQIIKCDLDGNELEVFDSIKDASKSVTVKPASINKALRKQVNTSGGFIWKYKEDNHNIIENIDLSDSILIIDHPKYRIFKDGKIFNIKRKAYLKPVKNDSGYCYVTLAKKDEKKKNYYVHKLVATHFIVNSDPTNKTQVNHKNKVRDDNRVENLEWVTPSENMIHCKTYDTKSN